MKTHPMTRRDFLTAIAASTAAMALAPTGLSEDTPRKPNILLIVSDDQGYGDSSCYFHGKEVTTPGIDRLAASGVRCTNGYASGWVCAPTRAGLLTGRYQQRFGFYTAGDSSTGLPLNEITLADMLKREGYATGIFGKWHVGLEAPYHPLKRGFDEFYGFLGHGAHDYFDLKTDPDQLHNAIYRNDKIIDDTGYLTDNLAREAIAFIERHKDEPFFCYLPFNAVHWPMQAPEEDIKDFNTGKEERDIYLAMLKRMDVAVGDVLDSVEKHGLKEKTLVVFFSDNGGAKKNSADNGKLRDYKQSVYEGGIRVPFIVSWPGQLQGGTTCKEPVISLDVFPTACAAVGIDLPGNRVYDGKDMLPVLKGEAEGPLHDALFWTEDGTQWGVRVGQWKLLTNRAGKRELYDLGADLGEKNDLSQDYPDVAARLQKTYDEWKSQMGPSINQARKKRKREPHAN